MTAPAHDSVPSRKPRRSLRRWQRSRGAGAARQADLRVAHPVRVAAAVADIVTDLRQQLVGDLDELDVLHAGDPLAAYRAKMTLLADRQEQLYRLRATALAHLYD